MSVPSTDKHVSSLPSRFWNRVDKSGECWLWLGSLNRTGYGNYWRAPTTVVAHRAAWEDIHGPIPPKMELDHYICRIHHCVNPDHVRVTTRKQNAENRAGANAGSKSGVRGVYWDKKRGKWFGQVKHNYRAYRIPGLFDTIAEAEKAVVAKRLELFTHSDMDKVKS